MKEQTPVQKNDDITLTIDSMGAEGQGVGRIDGYAVFVPGALPGETVLAHIIKATSSYGVAKLLQVVAPSPARVEPRCSRFSQCGGCALQHMDYAAQGDYKRQQVYDALVRLGGFKREIEVLPTLMMDEPWAYRNKGSFPFALVDGKVEVGFFAPRSHRLVVLTDCPIQKDPVLCTAFAVRDWANAYHVTAYDERTPKGILRHVVARVTVDGRVMAVIVTTGPLPHEQALIELLKSRVEGLTSVVHNTNRERTNVIFGANFQTLYGPAYLEDRICNLTFCVSGASFLQVNPVQTERLYQTVLEFLNLKGDERIVDVYCGIGTISLLLAQRCRTVIGIESVPEAIVDANENAKRNKSANARFLCATAEQALPELVRDGESIDAIVLDPPRKGAERSVLDAIATSGAKRVVYVSCNPATLARDAKVLCQSGYQLARVQPVDMFAHSFHVETVVLMTYCGSIKKNQG